MALIERLSDGELANVAEAVRQVQHGRAVGRGDLDSIIAQGFEPSGARS